MRVGVLDSPDYWTDDALISAVRPLNPKELHHVAIGSQHQMNQEQGQRLMRTTSSNWITEGVLTTSLERRGKTRRKAYPPGSTLVAEASQSQWKYANTLSNQVPDRRTAGRCKAEACNIGTTLPYPSKAIKAYWAPCSSSSIRRD